jgi:hypothetical protein
MSLRAQFYNRADADTTIQGLVGSQVIDVTTVRSILPKPGLVVPPWPMRPGVRLPPLPARPILALYVGQVNTVDVFIGVQTLTWVVLDDPGEQFHRIDRLMSELKRVYPYGNDNEYQDYGAVAFHTELVLESQDAVEDVTGLNYRWLDFGLWRA